jgi:hypothetical protein
MRDLYNRKARREYSIDRIKDLDGNDRQNVLKFVEIMQEKDQSILIINVFLASLGRHVILLLPIFLVSMKFQVLELLNYIRIIYDVVSLFSLLS